jgi:type IV pilus assembly protein PilZ
MSLEPPAPRETRAHVRAAIELKVEYKKMNTFFFDYTKNISKGGTFIKTDKPLKTGTEFVFMLSLPATPTPYVLKGKVMWTNTDATQQRPEVKDHGMGIVFIYTDPTQRRVFEDAVDELMRASLGDIVARRLMENTR